jgi:hypothetical protein
MATTSMDYEATGERYDGKRLCFVTVVGRARAASPQSLRATTAIDAASNNADQILDDGPRYDRDRSASPRRDDGHDSRRRSMSPIGNDRYVVPAGFICHLCGVAC